VRWTSNVLTAIAALVALLFIDWRMTLAALGRGVRPRLQPRAPRIRPLFRRRSACVPRSPAV
jgi:hypothetical protein